MRFRRRPAATVAVAALVAGLMWVGHSLAAPATLDRPATASAPAARLNPPKSIFETRVIGQSVQGRDIVASRMGERGGRPVLIVGVIHGDENKGALITKALRDRQVPPGIELWIVDSMNPDGQAAGTRQNANRVDLNRNFSRGWGYIPDDGTSNQYSGEAPGDQPETQALQDFVTAIKPAITIVYHQDATNVGSGGARKEISAAYAQLVGLPIGVTPCTKGCTGTFGAYANWRVAGGTSFIVELPPSSKVTTAMVNTHADAVMSVIVL